MKTFIEYLKESKEEKTYSFKIKVAGDLPEHFEDVVESALQKYQVKKFAKSKTTPIQAKLKDFPTMENAQVNIFDVDFEYPCTSQVLTSFISEHTGLTTDRIRVRSLKEESEAELNVENSEGEDSKEDKKALLTQDYVKENHQDKVGDKGVSAFLKDLAKIRKEHEMQQYKGVNDALLAKKPPKEKSQEMSKPAVSKGIFGSVSNPDPRKGK